jgi:hypothetical protein
MSVISSDLVMWGPANVVSDDTSTAGGAISTVAKPFSSHFSSAAKLSLTSDGTDVRVAAVTGRLADGTVATENVTLTNAVEVLSVNTYERVLSVVLASASGTRTVTLKQGAGGTTINTIAINETTRYCCFNQSFSISTGAKTVYDKVFIKNGNGTNALLNAQVTLTADGSGVLNIGVHTSVNDSATITNRLTAPAGITFVGTSSAQNVPGTNLAAGAAIGVWLRQSLLTSNAAIKSTFTVQLAGQTT